MKLVVVKIGKNGNLGNFMAIEKYHLHLKIPFFKHEIKNFVLKIFFFLNFYDQKKYEKSAKGLLYRILCQHVLVGLVW